MHLLRIKDIEKSLMAGVLLVRAARIFSAQVSCFERQATVIGETAGFPVKGLRSNVEAGWAVFLLSNGSRNPISTLIISGCPVIYDLYSSVAMVELLYPCNSEEIDNTGNCEGICRIRLFNGSAIRLRCFLDIP